MITKKTKKKKIDATGRYPAGSKRKKKRKNKMMERIPVNWTGEEGEERTGTMIITKGRG